MVLKGKYLCTWVHDLLQILVFIYDKNYFVPILISEKKSKIIELACAFILFTYFHK